MIIGDPISTFVIFATGHIWSPCYHPTAATSASYEATFAEDKVDFWRRDGRSTTHTEILVSPEDNVELRRISITNHADDVREFEITSYSEVVLAPMADDAAHPAFSNLFVQTEFVPDEKALLATRRRRTSKEAEIWGFHVLVVEGEVTEPLQYETDRARFSGSWGKYEISGRDE